MSNYKTHDGDLKNALKISSETLHDIKSNGIKNVSEAGKLSDVRIRVGDRKLTVAPHWSILGSSPHHDADTGPTLTVHTEEKSMKNVVEILEKAFNDKSVIEKLFYKNPDSHNFNIHLNIGCKGLMTYDGETVVEADFYIYTCSESQWNYHRFSN